MGGGSVPLQQLFGSVAHHNIIMEEKKVAQSLGDEMKAVAYIRVSTREQDEVMQRKAIEKFAEEKGIKILKYYIDKGVSGGKPFRKRPGMIELIQELDELKPDLLIAWALDRLSRGGILETFSIIEFFEKEKNVRIITLKEEWMKTLDPGIRDLIISLFSWMAEQERIRIHERQEEAWRQGKQKGRPPKVSDETIKKYLKRYRGLPMKSIWKIMKTDGHDISYNRFLERVKNILGINNFYSPEAKEKTITVNKK